MVLKIDFDELWQFEKECMTWYSQPQCLKVLDDGYESEYLMVNGVKHGCFKRIYREAIATRHYYKCVQGTYIKGQLDDLYTVYYYQYDDRHLQDVSVVLSFSMGQLVSYDLKVNGSLMTPKNYDSYIALLALPNQPLQQLCHKLGITNVPINTLKLC